MDGWIDYYWATGILHPPKWVIIQGLVTLKQVNELGEVKTWSLNDPLSMN